MKNVLMAFLTIFVLAVSHVSVADDGAPDESVEAPKQDSADC